MPPHVRTLQALASQLDGVHKQLLFQIRLGR